MAGRFETSHHCDVCGDRSRHCHPCHFSPRNGGSIMVKLPLSRFSLLATAIAVAACVQASADGSVIATEPELPAPDLSRWIVLDTSGQLVDVDPRPFMPDALRRRRQSERKGDAARTLSEGEREALRVPPLLRMWNRKPSAQQQRQPVDANNDDDKSEELDVLKYFEDEDESEEQTAEPNGADSNFVLLRPLLPDMLATDEPQEEIEPLQEVRDYENQMEEDEDSETSDTTLVAPNPINAPTTTSEAALVDEKSLGFIDFFIISVVPLDEDGIGSIKGAVLFAELSCVFVAFIAYLVHSIPLWPTFSRGQKGCLLIAFTAAAAFQVVVLLWYGGFLTPDVVLGLSSLMTRTISLGMVPITTTSFMGRVRMVCDEDDAPPSPRPTSSNATSSRHHRQLRARSS